MNLIIIFHYIENIKDLPDWGRVTSWKKRFPGATIIDVDSYSEHFLWEKIQEMTKKSDQIVIDLSVKRQPDQGYWIKSTSLLTNIQNPLILCTIDLPPLFLKKWKTRSHHIHENVSQEKAFSIAENYFK